jgi:diguanylate cyclase (GGDEF)-like protein/PAS domain S-box-containing protein
VLELSDQARPDVLIATAFLASRIGMAIFEPSGQLLVTNPSMAQIFGYSESQLLQMTIADLAVVGEIEAAAHLQLFGELSAGQRDGFELRTRQRHAEGHSIPVLLAANTVRVDDSVQFIVCQFTDLTEQVAAETALAAAEARHIAELERQATTDALTGLPNRVLAKRRLARATAAAASGRDGIAVAMCDLDHFKLVNDSAGHTVGDDLLIGVGAAMTAALAATRPDGVDDDAEVVARFGGDEFLIVLRGVPDLATAEQRMRRVVAAVDTVRVGARRMRTTLSCGLMAVPSGRALDPNDVVTSADAALYEAKARGRDRIEVFDEAMRDTIVAEADLTAELRDAIDAGDIRVEFQPIVTPTGHVDHVEALARWTNRDKVISPAVFIPLAERTGLMTRLGEAVAIKALSEIAKRNDQSGTRLPVALNVAGTQLEQAFAREFLDRIDFYGLTPGDIRLEITESTLLDPRRSIPTLFALNEAGIEIAIDDFGTGHSSFAYLRDLPVSTVKLDRTFTSDLAVVGSRASSVVAGMIDLAQRMDLRVVAEGVEHSGQWHRLVELGCDLFQGYLLGRPSPLNDVQSVRPPL